MIDCYLSMMAGINYNLRLSLLELRKQVSESKDETSHLLNEENEMSKIEKCEKLTTLYQAVSDVDKQCQSHFQNLVIFFATKSRHEEYEVFQEWLNFPNFTISAKQDRNIKVESNWSYDIHKDIKVSRKTGSKLSWANIPTNKEMKKINDSLGNIPEKTRCEFNLSQVQEVVTFSWGFQIITNVLGCFGVFYNNSFPYLVLNDNKLKIKEITVWDPCVTSVEYSHLIGCKFSIQKTTGINPLKYWNYLGENDWDKSELENNSGVLDVGQSRRDICI